MFNGVDCRRQIQQAQSRDLATVGCKEHVVVNLQHRSLGTMVLTVGWLRCWLRCFGVVDWNSVSERFKVDGTRTWGDAKIWVQTWRRSTSVRIAESLAESDQAVGFYHGYFNLSLRSLAHCRSNRPSVQRSVGCVAYVAIRASRTSWTTWRIRDPLIFIVSPIALLNKWTKLMNLAWTSAWYAVINNHNIVNYS